ncbi:hypothetical protein ACFXDJ_07465 [Streptomyces sp. NPDC059443]|uniref:hypothetical protein n=1 Tax=unclassified Streptomyces TaxID=2593676 RepID=UPI0036CD5651
MTQSTPQPPEYPADQGEGSADTVAGATGKAPGRGARLVRFTREGRARWVALGLVVAAAAGTAGVAAVVVADHDHGRTRAERVWDRFDMESKGDGPRMAPGPGRPGLKGEKGGKDGSERSGKQGREHGQGQGREQGTVVDRQDKAPVPLPALPAAQALAKAEAAVPGGKAEALRAIAQEGGGSAWRVVVLGSDGVRHVVTLAGADGAVTGNNVPGEGAKAGN